MKLIRDGFTMVELIVVITVLGILAALVVPRFAGAQTDTRVTAAGEDILAMARTFEFFNANNGYWPAETATGVMPTEIRTLFKRENPFLKPCPISGIYDYDNITTGNIHTLSISIRGSATSPTPLIADAQALDAYLDDGVLTTGKFRTSSGGYSYTFHKK